MTPATPRELFLGLANYYGIGPEVAALLQDRAEPMQPGLGLTLRGARRRSGATILGTFKRCNIARSQLSFYENGQQKNPGLRTIQALSYGYRIPMASLVAAILSDMQCEVPAAPGAAETAILEVRKRKRTGVR